MDRPLRGGARYEDQRDGGVARDVAMRAFGNVGRVPRTFAPIAHMASIATNSSTEASAQTPTRVPRPTPRLRKTERSWAARSTNARYEVSRPPSMTAIASGDFSACSAISRSSVCRGRWTMRGPSPACRRRMISDGVASLVESRERAASIIPNVRERGIGRTTRVRPHSMATGKRLDAPPILHPRVCLSC